MADFFTLKEKLGDLASMKLAYIGDGNNVCHSLMFASAKAGCTMMAATPNGYEPNADCLELAIKDAAETGARIAITHDPFEAVDAADAVYTDTWASMGQEDEKEQRKSIFAPYQVNQELISRAKEEAFFMHCLPAHRGEEVTDQVIDSPRSIIFDQAENRLHIQKAIMVLLLGNKA